MRPHEPIKVVVPAEAGVPHDVRQGFRGAALALETPIAGVQTTGGAEVANVRRFTLQVVDRQRRPLAGVFPVTWWIATSDGGQPAGAQTVALVTGLHLATYLAHQAFRTLTDAAGKIEADVTVAGAGTRFIVACVDGVPTCPAGFTYL